MHRREFLKLSPAAATATATLTLTEPGHEPEPFDVGVLRLKPGDVIVLQAPGGITCETAQRLGAYVEQQLGVRAMVLGDGLTVAGVLRGAGAGGGDRGGGRG